MACLYCRQLWIASKEKAGTRPALDSGEGRTYFLGSSIIFLPSPWTVSVLLRKSDNTGCESKVDYGVGSFPTSVAVGDFNGDGRQDLLLSGADGEARVLLAQAGVWSALVAFS